MADYTDEQLSKMSHAEMANLRNTPNMSQETKDRYANYEHRAFAREVVQEKPAMIAALPAAIPAYYAAKKVGVVDQPTGNPEDNTSNASLEQVKQATIGYAEGIGNLVNENITKPLMKPWEKVYQKSVAVVRDITNVATGNMPWDKVWQKEDVSIAKPLSTPTDMKISPEVQAARDIEAGKLRVHEAGGKEKAQSDIALLEKELRDKKLSGDQRSVLKSHISMLKAGIANG